MKPFSACLAFFAAFFFMPNLSAQSVKITVHLDSSQGNMTPLWAWFGYDEPNYTYMKDGKKLLSEIAAFSNQTVFVRTHSLLVTGDAQPGLKWGSTNAYTEDQQGKPVYNWTIIDSIFDTYISRGMKPLAQIGFMPEALSSHPVPYRHHWKPGDPYNDIYTGWAYPPNDYNKWQELVYQWVKHSVARYGQKEVESWYWEVWNEPNISYWKGTWQEFFKLYDYAVAGVKRALPSARIGGPDVTGGGMKFLDAFLRHCLFETNFANGKIGTPLELLLFHAKGSPKLENGTVVMSAKAQLKNIEDHMKLIASFPELKGIPVIIGESDPEGCAACGMATDPQNAYRNGTMYSSYTAATFARKYELAKKYNINLIGAVTWAFEFENQPWFFGFRDLATNGVDKPVLNVFRMFAKMKGDLVKTHSSGMHALQTLLDSSVKGAQNDVGALASKNLHKANILVWNYHDADKKGDTADVQIFVQGLPAPKVSLKEFRIDDAHSNSYEVWKKMGAPQQPSPRQIEQLEQAGLLKEFGKAKSYKTKNGTLEFSSKLPRQGVSLFEISW